MWVLHLVIIIVTHSVAQLGRLTSGAGVLAHTMSVLNLNFSKKSGFLASVGGEQLTTVLHLQQQELTAVSCVFGEARN
jgi:hypothetical protein